MNASQDKDAVRAYFEAEARRFDAIYDGTNRSALQGLVDAAFRTRMLRRRNEAIASLVRDGADCFEIGCGSGRTAIAIASLRKARIEGIDMAAQMIEIARARATAAGVADLCRFDVGEFGEWRPARRYDTFVAVGVLDYFDDPLPMLRTAAAEFLLPGGAIVLSWSEKFMALNLARRAWLQGTKGCPVRFYGAKDIRLIAEALGGRIATELRSGFAPLIVDGMARIEL
jgi:cyclopropane-fatty-acyl-phospholipid synthase